MNGYLNRLVSRRLGIGEVQSLQPIVRSASPIAERDQRIGMEGFEGFPFSGPSLVAADQQVADPEKGEAVQRSVSHPIAGISNAGEATMQRKKVNPSDASTGSDFAAVPSFASVVKARTVHKNQPVIPSLNQSDAHLPSEVPSVAKRNKQFVLSESDAEAAVGKASMVAQNNIAEELEESTSPIKDTLAEKSKAGHLQPEGPRQHHHGTTHARSAWQVYQKPDMPYLGPLPLVIAEHKGAASEDGNTRTKDTLAETSIAEHLPSEDSRQHPHHGITHDRSVWPTYQKSDVPYLEPSLRVIAEHIGATSEDTNTPPYDVDESPRVVIGKINVEVVSPSVTQPSTAAQTGPLTAASVSVIGPLGGGASVSRRLSLRYR